MRTDLKYYLAGLCFVLYAFSATAQKDAKQYMAKAPANVSIDGKLTEWGDSLALYDIKSKLNYTIASDDTDLYVIAYVADKPTKRKIMAAGITISVNPEGKKHKTYSMTYPVPDGSAIFKPHSASDDDEEDEVQKPSLLQSTSIKVAGFKDVESDVITTSNTYGFKAAVKFDDKHNLVYEAAIPIKMLYLKKGKNDELEINIQINAVERPDKGSEQGSGGGMGGGGRGSGGGGMGGGGGRGGGRHGGGGGGQSGSGSAGSMGEATDFWVKMALAQH